MARIFKADLPCLVEASFRRVAVPGRLQRVVINVSMLLSCKVFEMRIQRLQTTVVRLVIKLPSVLDSTRATHQGIVPEQDSPLFQLGDTLSYNSHLRLCHSRGRAEVANVRFLVPKFGALNIEPRVVIRNDGVIIVVMRSRLSRLDTFGKEHLGTVHDVDNVNLGIFVEWFPIRVDEIEKIEPCSTFGRQL